MQTAKLKLDSWSLSISRAQQLETLIKNTNYQLIQTNGQRVYSPSAASGIPPPPKGTELFVGNLPPDLYEDEIIPLFSRKGAVYSVRLMMDFFGRNRGYAFVAYFRVEDAHEAAAALHNYKIRPGTKMAVTMSVDNRRLFIGNIPKQVQKADVQGILEKFVDGIVEVILYKEPYDEGLNRGFVFVEFETHRLAAIARRQLSPGNLVIWGQPIFVDWAEPLPVVNPLVMRQVTKLYLSNIPSQITSESLKTILCNFIDPLSLIKVHKINNFAFVHFTLRKYAEEGFTKLKGLVIGNKEIGVEWARPIEYSRIHRTGRVPDNFCRSVPPSMRKLVQETIELKNGPKNKKKGSSCGTDGSEYTDYFNRSLSRESNSRNLRTM